MLFFYGVGYGSAIKYYSLAPMILADIYRALYRCKKGTCFFQGCNLILQWWMIRHLIKTYDPTKPDPLERPNRLESHDWWVQRNHFNRIGGQEKTPYLIFAGLRGTRPYAPSRVLRQLGGKQELSQIEDMTRFVTDHENGEVIFSKKMLQLWKTRRSLAETIEPGPNIPHITADVGAKHQIRLHQLQEKFDRNELEHQRRHSEDAKVIAQLKQEIIKSKQCMSELDDSMEQQIQSVEKFRHQEGARLARDHPWANKYAMWEEVSIAKRSRLGERSG
ncbi:hypothetical protein KY285_023601 [Solanum tuberosum]|nr:hypothetical protein KY289_023933 [Solanum tuberosum]KAH0675800.1 hypothetical protein KY285_023601 [Solanum tuberosum]